MSRRMRPVVLGLVLLGGDASAEIPRVITYQGKVTGADGSPRADGTYGVRFDTYDAVVCGTQLWNSGALALKVTGGVFSVLLGDSPLPAIALEFGEDYALQVNIGGDVQSRRVRLGSVGCAYMASGLVPGTEVSGAASAGTSAAIRGTNTAASEETYGVLGVSSSTEGQGVSGVASASSCVTYGLYGRVHPLRRGVYTGGPRPG